MNANRMYYSNEAEMRAARERTTLAVVCLALGLGVGTVVALMFAPANGRKTRDELVHSLEEGVQHGRERVEPAVAQLEHDLSELRKKVEARLS